MEIWNMNLLEFLFQKGKKLIRLAFLYFPPNDTSTGQGKFRSPVRKNKNLQIANKYTDIKQ